MSVQQSERAKHEFNPFDPDYLAHPYEHFDWLRVNDPVHRNQFGVVVLTRYADVLLALRDPRFTRGGHADIDTSENEAAGAVAGSSGRFIDVVSKSLIFADPPAHTRLRRIVSKAFTPKAVQALRARVQGMVDRLLTDALERGEVDVVADFAYPLPAAVISEMLGLPSEDWDEIRSWTDAILLGNEPKATDEERRAADEAMDGLWDRIEGAVAERRAHPRDDMLSGLAAAEDAGDRLTHEELMGTVVILYIGGHETTVNLISMGTMLLAQNPAQAEDWRADPELSPNAILELLRLETPASSSIRILAEEVDLHGTVLAPGTVVMPHFGAANRDPAMFDDPARLNLRRANAADHLAFGFGLHHCLGAALARLEGEVALGSLVQRTSGIEITGDYTWKELTILRGLNELPVRLTA